MLLAFGLVANFSHTQNAAFVRESRQLAQSALNERIRALSNLSIEYGVWDEAYVATSVRWNERWLEDNFYTSVADALLVVDAQGARAPYAWIAQSFESEGSFLPAVLGAAPVGARGAAYGDMTRVSLGVIDGQPALMASAPIMRDEENSTAPVDNYVVMVDVLTPEEISEIGAALDLEQIRFVQGGHPAAHDAVALPLAVSGAASIGALVWRNERPGSATFASEMAPIIISLLLAGALAVFIAHRQVSSHVRVAAQAQAALASERIHADFISTMSHELRTPLNSIMGYAELIQEEAGENAEGEAIRNDAGRVLDAAKQLRNLVNDILDHTRIDAGRLRLSIDRLLVGGVLAELEEALEPAARANGDSLVVVNGAGDRDVLADDARLQQCLGNLIGNAIKFTKNGTITVSARIEAREQQEFVVFDVADTGVGIAAEVLPKLFQPFVQAHPDSQIKYGGTGLGLSLALKLARAMGGDITADSALGKGAVFSLALPAAAKLKADQPAPAPIRTAA